MRWTLAFVVVLAGCLQGPVDEDEADARQPPTMLPPDPRDLHHNGTTIVAFDLQHCIEYGGVFPVPEGTIDLPAGFAPAPGPGGQPFILEVIYECDSGLATVAEDLWMMPVIPPHELADPEARFQVLLLAAASQGAADIYDAWGFGDMVVDGTVRMFDAAEPEAGWGTDTPWWNAEVRVVLAGETSVGSAGYAIIYHPEDPTNRVKVEWSDYETKFDGGAAWARMTDVPNMPATLFGTPFVRSGTEYHWTISHVPA